ncbi:extracellular solute-binding protein family 1 [Ancylobacter novellus DSM 506]|uniref:Extracellular solute-binding protein family 1 n=1 Tax=Ancylobacter novellus (strain ATCC 8093 / DSM 506 / JCM 20403 / CCM 1077 / IAM 12100 / NBRC 12443 / NCIMB 10456) TaxID=639283 RepID=D7A4B0_ANCN5|nr:extracellular solute-binding protein [Ancylobacter novellus]ADH87930.1 extracellular solute-binding protein family 1 [Ancylobacter novellus DSM 506]
MVRTAANSLARRLAVAGSLAAGLALAPLGASAEEVVNIYTTREPGLAKPLFDAFTAKTGVKVNSVFVKDGLAERVKAEGEGSPADVLMTVDIGSLLDLVDQGVTQPVKSDVLEKAIPANLRAPDGSWYALSARARVAYLSKDRVKLDAITYEDFADPKYKGEVCIRSGKHPYNTALIAAYIVHHGEAKAEEWLKGVKANLARKAAGGDREVARDILGDICDLGLANSYYVGLMRSGKGGPEQEEWAKAINVVLPTFQGGGTHVNISGATVAKNAPNKGNAVKLLEYLVSPEAQDLYAKGNYEYPVVPEAPVDPIIAAFGPLKVDNVDLVAVAKARKAAANLADKVGFDN